MIERRKMTPVHNIPRHIDKERQQLRRIALQRRLRKIAVFVGVIIFLGFVFGGDLGVIAMIRSIRYKKKLELAIAAEKKRAQKLSAQIQKLAQDTFYIEQIARTRYGMARENELIFIFPDSLSGK